MLSRRAMHMDPARRGHIHADFLWIVHPHPVFDDLSVEAGLAEFLCHVIRCCLVFGRTCDVRGLSQHSQVLLGKLGVGHGKETGFDICFLRRIAEAENRGTGFR